MNASSGSTNWTDPGRAVTANGTGAYIRLQSRDPGRSRDATTNYLQLTNATLGVPGGATIRGIEVEVNAAKVGAGIVRLENLALVGPRTSSNRGQGFTDFNSTYRREDFGGSGDLWGRSWTASELNRANFGIRMQVYASTECPVNGSGCPRTLTFGVDDVRARVHYEVCE